MRTSRRFHLGLPSDLRAELAGFAHSHGLGLGPAIRLLVAQALDPADSARPADSLAALAALTAAEHAVLMVASILPEGERRMRSLAERASQAAEERLLLFQEQAAAPEEVSR